MMPSGTTFREGDFRSILAQGLVDPKSEVYDIFRSRNLPSISGEKINGNSKGLCCLGNLLNKPD